PPTDQWIDVRTLGVKGDGTSDDTAALKAAIAGHRVLYFPSGFYPVTDTLTLRPDTVLIGLHPSTTQIVLADGSRFDPYDAYHAGDKDPRKRWDAQYHSIWVTDGGGGTFANVWSPDTYAQSGFYV